MSSDRNYNFSEESFGYSDNNRDYESNNRDYEANNDYYGRVNEERYHGAESSISPSSDSGHSDSTLSEKMTERISEKIFQHSSTGHDPPPRNKGLEKDYLTAFPGATYPDHRVNESRNEKGVATDFQKQWRDARQRKGSNDSDSGNEGDWNRQNVDPRSFDSRLNSPAGKQDVKNVRNSTSLDSEYSSFLGRKSHKQLQASEQHGQQYGPYGQIHGQQYGQYGQKEEKETEKEHAQMPVRNNDNTGNKNYRAVNDSESRNKTDQTRGINEVNRNNPIDIDNTRICVDTNNIPSMVQNVPLVPQVSQNVPQVSKKVLQEASFDLQCVVDFLCGVQRGVEEEADLELKSILNQEQLHLKRQRRGERGSAFGQHEARSEEEITLSQTMDTLSHAIVRTLSSISTCIGSRKAAYQGQIKRMRDISNAAIRNTVQAEKLDASHGMNHLRGVFEGEKRGYIERCERELIVSRAAMDRLGGELDTARENILKYQEKEIHSAEESSKNILRALKEQREFSAREQEDRQRELFEENGRLKGEVLAIAAATSLQNKVFLDAQRYQYEETISLLMGDKKRAEGEIERVRGELEKALSVLFEERERSAHRLAEDRIGYEREMQEARTESVKKQAQLRSEAITALHLGKESEGKKLMEMERGNAREREAMILSHLMDSEKSGERHQTELKRQQSLSATKLQDQLAAMKSAHKREIESLMKQRTGAPAPPAPSSSSQYSQDDSTQNNRGNSNNNNYDNFNNSNNDNNKGDNRKQNNVNFCSSCHHNSIHGNSDNDRYDSNAKDNQNNENSNSTKKNSDNNSDIYKNNIDNNNNLKNDNDSNVRSKKDENDRKDRNTKKKEEEKASREAEKRAIEVERKKIKKREKEIQRRENAVKENEVRRNEFLDRETRQVEEREIESDKNNDKEDNRDVNNENDVDNEDSDDCEGETASQSDDDSESDADDNDDNDDNSVDSLNGANYSRKNESTEISENTGMENTNITGVTDESLNFTFIAEQENIFIPLNRTRNVPQDSNQKHVPETILLNEKFSTLYEREDSEEDKEETEESEEEIQEESRDEKSDGAEEEDDEEEGSEEEGTEEGSEEEEEEGVVGTIRPVKSLRFSSSLLSSYIKQDKRDGIAYYNAGLRNDNSSKGDHHDRSESPPPPPPPTTSITTSIPYSSISTPTPSTSFPTPSTSDPISLPYTSKAYPYSFSRPDTLPIVPPVPVPPHLTHLVPPIPVLSEILDNNSETDTNSSNLDAIQPILDASATAVLSPLFSRGDLASPISDFALPLSESSVEEVEREIRRRLSALNMTVEALSIDQEDKKRNKPPLKPPSNPPNKPSSNPPNKPLPLAWASLKASMADEEENGRVHGGKEENERMGRERMIESERMGELQRGKRENERNLEYLRSVEIGSSSTDNGSNNESGSNDNGSRSNESDSNNETGTEGEGSREGSVIEDEYASISDIIDIISTNTVINTPQPPHSTPFPPPLPHDLSVDGIANTSSTPIPATTITPPTSFPSFFTSIMPPNYSRTATIAGNSALPPLPLSSSYTKSLLRQTNSSSSKINTPHYDSKYIKSNRINNKTNNNNNDSNNSNATDAIPTPDAINNTSINKNTYVSTARTYGSTHTPHSRPLPSFSASMFRGRGGPVTVTPAKKDKRNLSTQGTKSPLSAVSSPSSPPSLSTPPSSSHSSPSLLSPSGIASAVKSYSNSNRLTPKAPLPERNSVRGSVELGKRSLRTNMARTGSKSRELQKYLESQNYSLSSKESSPGSPLLSHPVSRDTIPSPLRCPVSHDSIPSPCPLSPNTRNERRSQNNSNYNSSDTIDNYIGNDRANMSTNVSSGMYNYKSQEEDTSPYGKDFLYKMPTNRYRENEGEGEGGGSGGGDGGDRNDENEGEYEGDDKDDDTVDRGGGEEEGEEDRGEGDSDLFQDNIMMNLSSSTASTLNSSSSIYGSLLRGGG